MLLLFKVWRRKDSSGSKHALKAGSNYLLHNRSVSSHIAGRRGFLGGLTHLIIDEVHCRDRYTDMLLGIIRTRLCKFPGLRLILLSDSVFCNVLSTYFFKCSIVKTSISVKPNMELFLEEILTCTKFLAKQDDPSCIHGRTDIVCLISHGADPTMKVRRALASDTACYI